MVYNCLQKLRSMLYPPHCRLCLAPSQSPRDLCDDCRDELPWLQHTCPGCALPLPAESTISHCPECQKRPPQLDRCEALFAYRRPVDHWIQQMKFHRDLTAARLLGDLLAETFPPDTIAMPVNILPVPLHRRRLAQRGYNQSLEIARPLLDRGVPLAKGTFRRHKATRAQSDLPARLRHANIRGAFSVAGPLEGQCILLIDDVLTTGATLNELARTLKHAGAVRVEARVIARTL
ncbi:MAG: ComF family protein [Gammaproteobacteria bacterium]|nr:MAG: ComF family protein [Gammaproteobacteria bacterium]